LLVNVSKKVITEFHLYPVMTLYKSLFNHFASSTAFIKSPMLSPSNNSPLIYRDGIDCTQRSSAIDTSSSKSSSHLPSLYTSINCSDSSELATSTKVSSKNSSVKLFGLPDSSVWLANIKS